ncbi:MAG: hypothetical protein WCO78_02225 [Candidatus Roizmanbacteria bacterium]
MIAYFFTQTPLVWFVQSYWRDEAFSVLLAQRPWLELLQLTARDFSPPLYYLLLKIWMMFMGTSEIATRSLSLVCYVLTVFVMVEFLVHVLHYQARKAAVWGIIAGIFTPLLVYYAFETRGYTLLAFLSMLSTYALCTHKWKMYTIAMIAGLFTHYLMCFLLAIHILIYFRGLIGRHPTMTFARLFALPIGGFGVWFLFTLYLKYGQLNSGFWVPHPSILTLLTSPALLLTGYDSGWGFGYDLIPLSIIIAGIVCIPFLRNYHTTKTSLILFLSSIGIVLGVYAFSVTGSISLFIARYLILASPPLVILLIIQLHSFKGIFRAIWIAALLISLWQYQAVNISKRHKENIAQTIASAKQTARKNDYLLVSSELDYHTAQIYWFDPNHVKIIGKKYDDIPSYVGKVLIPREAITVANPCQSGCVSYLLDNSRHISVFASP